MATTNKEIVKKVNDAFNQSDMNGFLDACADNVQWTIVGKAPITGKAAIKDFMGEMDSASPMQIIIGTIIAEGDQVACSGTMHMKHEGGKPYDGAFCDIYHFADGKIAALHSYVIDIKDPGATAA